MLHRAFAFTMGGFDPATMPAKGWWRANNIGPSPWVGEPSTGLSGSRNLIEATNPPSAGFGGQLVNGFAPAIFDGVNDQVGTVLSTSSFISASAYYWWLLFYSESAGGSNTLPTSFDNPTIWTDGGGAFVNCAIRTVGGIDYIQWYHYSAGVVGNEHAFERNTWNLLQVRYDGTNIRSRLNDGPIIVSAAVGAVSALSNQLRVGRTYNSATFWKGRTLDFELQDTSESDARTNDLISYARRRYALPLSTLPRIDSTSVFLADTGGGDSVTITGAFLESATACLVGGTSATITANTFNSLTFTMPAKAEGTYTLQVVTSVGTSNTYSLRAWDPSAYADVTVLFDSKHTSYSAGAWNPRYAISGITGVNLGMITGANLTAVGGMAVFPGSGAAGSSGGLQTASALLSDFLGPIITSGAFQSREGSIASCFKSTNTATLNDAGPYANPAAIMNAAQGTVGIAFGNDTGSIPTVSAHMYDGANYNVRKVAAAANTMHAVLSRWGEGTNFDLSVDGALSGAGFHSAASLSGHATANAYATYRLTLGVAFPGNTLASQIFAGTVAAYAVLKAKASDAFVTDWNEWTRARGWRP